MRHRPLPQLFQSFHILTALVETLLISIVTSPVCDTLNTLVAISFMDQTCPAGRWDNDPANIRMVAQLISFFMSSPKNSMLRWSEVWSAIEYQGHQPNRDVILVGALLLLSAPSDFAQFSTGRLKTIPIDPNLATGIG
jgi:hypothetical protein